MASSCEGLHVRKNGILEAATYLTCLRVVARPRLSYRGLGARAATSNDVASFPMPAASALGASTAGRPSYAATLGTESCHGMAVLLEYEAY